MLKVKDNNQPRKFPLGTRLSLVLMFIIVNILITDLVFRHEHNVKFPPLIQASPCDMPQSILKKFAFISTKEEYNDDFSGIEAVSCKYYREGYTFTNQLTRDEIILTRMQSPHTVPTNFDNINPRNTQGYMDRMIQSNREIRETCTSDTQCLVYIEPNILMRLIYRTGATSQQDALLIANLYAQEQSKQDQGDF